MRSASLYRTSVNWIAIVATTSSLTDLSQLHEIAVEEAKETVARKEEECNDNKSTYHSPNASDSTSLTNSLTHSAKGHRRWQSGRGCAEKEGRGFVEGTGGTHRCSRTKWMATQTNECLHE